MTRADRTYTAAEAEKQLGIPAATIRSWHRRHRQTGLRPTGLDRHERPLFREIDLKRLRRGLKIRHIDGDWIAPS